MQKTPEDLQRHFPVVTAEQFDQLYQEGLLQPYQILAWTVMPWPRLKDDLDGHHADDHQWIQNLDYSRHQKGLWPRRTTHYQINDDPRLQWRRLRNYYGWPAGMSDVLRNHFPEVAEKVYASDYWKIVRLGKEYAQFAPIENVEQLVALTRLLCSEHGSQPKESKVLDYATSFLNSCGSITVVNEILSLAAKRTGLQVVYGGFDFERYLAEAERQHEHSEVHRAEKLAQRIPADFISYLIPLGEYEREMVLKHIS